jgi:hypothetical protein
MSNYLFAFGKKHSLTLVHDYFSLALHGSENEITFAPAVNDYWILVIGNRPDHHESNIVQSTEFNSEPEGKTTGYFFRGQALDHHSSSMILGLHGFVEFAQTHVEYQDPTAHADFEGTFVLARWNDECLTIQNDLFSLFRILCFSTDELFIASDSLFLLSQTRKCLSLPRIFNRRVMLSKAWDVAGLASSPLANETIIDGIQTLTAGKSIMVTFGSDGLITQRIERNVREMFESDYSTYKEALAECAKRMYTSINFIVESFNPVINFGLSGGLDSRVLLALCMKSQKIMDSICINTSTHIARIKDFEVVTSLSAKYGFSFNDGERRNSMVANLSAKRIKIPNTFGFWVLNGLGAYDSFYLDNHYWSNPSVLNMLGVGAEPVKQVMDKGKIRWRARGQHQLIRESVISQMNEAVISMGIDCEAPDALKWHHMAFKATHHIGRNVAVSNMLIRPYVQQAVFAISRIEENPFRGTDGKGPSVLHDLLIILNPELAAEPFDSEWKNITLGYIDERKSLLGGVIDIEEIAKPKIFGTVEDISNGPAECFLTAVHDYQWIDERPHKLQLADMITEQYEKVTDPEFKEMYENCYNKAIEQLNDDFTEISFAGALASRFLILMLLD